MNQKRTAVSVPEYGLTLGTGSIANLASWPPS